MPEECPKCGTPILQPFPFWWDKKTTFENLELVKKVCKAIFKVYPGAVIREIFHNSDSCIVHFNAWGGYGSDSVCIGSDGSWSQFMAGDLCLNELETLEEMLKPICAEYHEKQVESRISEGMKWLFE